ncbi:hypothetical protein [Providencia alcalifaciens]|uniref:hypothetical protein n=1 Tax=Providencia alcalifaciens TaxID=126385 RepID=UPI00044D76DF|nr:hypothetical protein [Providencia alcalifaciens]EUD07270.1 CS5 fimbrial subunit [Providencia alcalifaciens R90-1475]
MKTKLIALAALIMSTTSMAAVTTGELRFSWEGQVPTAPIVGSGWAFVNGSDIPYTPSVEQLNMSLDSTGKLTAVSAKPYEFFIVPVTGTPTPGQPVNKDDAKTFNEIQAYLGSTPVSAGFAQNKQLQLSEQAIANDGQVSITLNGTPLKVGAQNPTPVTRSGNNKSGQVSIQLNAKAASTDITEGASVTFTAPVVFSVNIA